MRRMLVLGVCFLLVACSSGDGDESVGDSGTSGERDGKVREPPPPPGIRIVREETVDVEVDTYIQCWNQEVCTEEYRIIRPEEIPLTRVKPGSDIRISFSSGEEPEEVTLLRNDPATASTRTTGKVKVLEQSGPSRPGTYRFELHAFWNGKGGGHIIYSFRLEMTE